MSLPKVLKFGFTTIAAIDPLTGNETRVARSKDINFAEVVARALNVEYEMVLSTDGQFGSMLKNGTFTGPMGLVQRGAVDLVVTDLAISTERLTAANFSSPYYIDGIAFTTKRPHFSPKFMAILQPFSLELWLCVMTSVLVACGVFYAVLRSSRRWSFQRVALKTFGSLLGKTSVFESDRLGERTLLLCWSAGTMFLAYSYTAVLLSFLTLPVRERGVRTIPELARAIAEGRFQAGTFRGNLIPEVMKKSEDASLRIIGNEVENHLMKVDEMKDYLLASDGNVALISPRIYLAYMDSRCFTSDDYFFRILLSLPYRKGFCCPKLLDIAVNRVVAAGLFQKIQSHFTFQMFLEKLSPSERFEPETELKLDLTDVSGAFSVLLIGLCLSTLTFALEMVVGRRSGAKKKKR